MKIGLSETQENFVFSSAPIVWLIGPQGEGKTYAGFVALFYHSSRLEGKTVRAAIIRDTFQNIKTMTIPSINDAISFLAAENPDDADKFINSFVWSDGGKKLTGPGIDVDLFGIDDLGSITKLQGGEYSLIWLEEPAPMFDRANAGLSYEVFTGALSRVARQRGAVPRLQITMNPADEDHWTHEEAIVHPINRPENMPDVWTEVFNIPYGENAHLTSMQRQVAKAAFQHDKGLWMRYVEGKFAFVQSGEAVTPEYDESIHRSKVPLTPYPDIRGFRFWDGGHNPTCIIAQIHPVTGRLQVYNSIVGENIGMIQLVRGTVRPLISSKFDKVTEWVDTGDASLRTSDDSNTDMSPARVIEDELKTAYLPGVQDWDSRRQGVKYILQNMPMLLLDPAEENLHKALRGGWHYAKNASGQVIRDGAVKNIHSHPGDALSHGLPRIITVPRPDAAKAKKKKEYSYLAA